MKTVLRLACLALSALALAGCGTSTRLPPAQAGDPTQQPDFALLTDIPILSGAVMDNDRSLILGERDRWTGRVVMKVNRNAPETTAFYQQQMPAFGWEPIMAATSGISVMSYVRADRASTVQIEAGSMWGATVLVTVAPRTTTGSAAPGGYGASSNYRAPAASAPVAAPPAGTVNSQPLR